MGGEPGPTDDVAGTGRLHQLLVVGGLVLFVTGLMVAGVIGNIESPLSSIEEPGPPLDRSGSGPSDDVIEESPDDSEAAEDPSDETSEDPPANETPEEPPANESDDEPPGEASFAVTNLVVPANATVGDVIQVDVEIDNHGDAGGTTLVAITFDGDVIEEDEFTLEANASTAATYQIDTGRYDEGNYQVEVTIDGDREQAWIELEGESAPSFEIVQLDVPENATIGENVDVTYTIRNNGDARGTSPVTLAFDDAVIGEGEVTLDPGQSASGSTQIDTSGYDQGEYPITLTTEHDEESERITLEGEGESAFVVTELNVPENATVGDVIDAQFTISNDGDASGTTNVTIAFDGEVIFEDRVTLGPGESIDFTVQIDTSGYEEGEYPVRVTTADDSQRAWVTLHEEEAEDDGGILDL